MKNTPKKKSLDPKDSTLYKNQAQLLELEQKNQNLKSLIEKKQKLLDSFLISKNNDKSDINEAINSSKYDFDAVEKEKRQIQSLHGEIMKITKILYSEDLEIATLEQKRMEILNQRSEFLQMKQTVHNAENQLKEQRKQRELLLDKLLVLKNQLSALEGIEWERQKIVSINTLNDHELNEQSIKMESENLIKIMKKKNEQKKILETVYEKWKNRTTGIPAPSHSIDELLEILQNKKASNTSELEQKLHTLIESNTEKQNLLSKEKKANLKRIKQILHVQAEMKKQTIETHEKIQREENRTVQKILKIKN